jgi:putative phosphoserine phosphatase / 1-acylglycerol-3-phosphate O-acyltransferase
MVERPGSPSRAFPVFVIGGVLRVEPPTVTVRWSAPLPDGRSLRGTMAGAAIFDLDRTLLRGASGPVLSQALRAAGIGPSRAIPGEQLLYGVFTTFGETLPSMAIARQAATLAKGRPQATMQAAAQEAAAVLASQLQPRAAKLFRQHREAGDALVMATTTPYDLVKPFADLLGFDDVVATRYGVSADGTYDGSIVGPFVWSAGKLAAVKTWAREHGVDLKASAAYSDSVYDTPLLSAVGRPFAVNPDPRLLVLATLRRWPVLHLDAPPGVPKLLGLEPQQVVLFFARPEAFPYARFDIAGIEHIPRKGAAILVGNHRSYFDPAAIGVTVAKTGRPVRFLGKKEVFDAPVVGQLAKAMGGIRVERGTGSDEPLKAAAEALEGGELVALMPQGTIPRGHAFFDPAIKGRWGAARLAALTGAPVIPVGLWGTERVWPRSARVPDVLNLTSPPTIRIRVGEPVALKYKSADKDTGRIMQAIRDLLPPEANEVREPTAEELARTFPPGYKGDPAKETERRPGTD